MIKELNIIRIFKNPTLAFIIMTLGTVGQSFHTFYIVKQINLFTGLFSIISSIILAVFFSSGLLYFSVKQGIANSIKDHVNEDKYSRAANTFQVLETFINLFYWSYKILYNTETNTFDFSDWFTLIAAIPLAIGLPAVLRFYAGEIKEIIPRNKEQELDDKLKEVNSKLKEINNKLNALSNCSISFEHNNIPYVYNNAKINLNE